MRFPGIFFTVIIFLCVLAAGSPVGSQVISNKLGDMGAEDNNSSCVATGSFDYWFPDNLYLTISGTSTCTLSVLS